MYSRHGTGLSRGAAYVVPVDVFDPPVRFGPTAVVWFVVAGVFAAASMVSCGRADREASYDPNRAWSIALMYFAACWALAAVTNVGATLTARSPLGDGAMTDAGFVIWSLACIAVEVVAYGVIWPMGTLTHGRPRRPGWQLGFGLLWGLSEAQLFLSIWAISERFVPGSRWIGGIVAFTLISAFTGIWHDKFWDIHVAPEHNIDEWNARKVFLCHIPNLLITLTFLAVHRSPGLFVLFQTLSLMLSVWFMRFPAPGDTAAIVRAPTTAHT